MRVPPWTLTFLLLASTVAGATSAQIQHQPAANPLLDSASSRRIAEKIITESARVRPGELVLLFGGDRDLPFLEDLAVATRRAGANAIVEYGTSRLTRRYYDELPASLDTVPPDTKLLSVLDVVIATDYIDGSVLQGIDPKRLAARSRAEAPFREALTKWKGRFIQVGNGLYPSASNAAEAGVTRAQLADLFRRGLDADYGALEQSADRIRDLLARGQEVRVTDSHGTQFSARLGGGEVRTSDGVISDADLKQTKGHSSAFLPAGEVYVIAQKGSAHGTLSMPQAWSQHAKITGLKVSVSDGRVTDFSARSGFDALRTRYEAADTGKSVVGVIDIGINPEVRPPAGSRLLPWSQAGMVTITFGNDQWAGGDNTSDFIFPVQLTDATVTVDGVALIENGKLLPSSR
jgi:leucyl aminopeptidase (aminopeptidase T)